MKFRRQQRVKFFDAVNFGAGHRDCERRLAQIVLHAGFDVLAQARINQSFADGGGGAAEERVRQNFQAEVRERVESVAHDQVQREETFLRRIFFRANRINFSDAFHLGEGGVEVNRRINFNLFKLAEVFAVEVSELLGNVHVAVKVNETVRRVIKFFVEGDKIFLCQSRNGFGFAARLKAVTILRKSFVQKFAAQDVVGGGKRALHFVVNDAAVSQRRVDVFNLVMPALLHENFGRGEHGGIEDRVQVNVLQVSEIFCVAAGDGVNGFVGISHGVEESVERAFDQFDERFLERIFF